MEYYLLLRQGPFSFSSRVAEATPVGIPQILHTVAGNSRIASYWANQNQAAAEKKTPFLKEKTLRNEI